MYVHVFSVWHVLCAQCTALLLLQVPLTLAQLCPVFQGYVSVAPGAPDWFGVVAVITVYSSTMLPGAGSVEEGCVGVIVTSHSLVCARVLVCQLVMRTGCISIATLIKQYHEKMTRGVSRTEVVGCCIHIRSKYGLQVPGLDFCRQTVFQSLSMNVLALLFLRLVACGVELPPPVARLQHELSM